MSDASPAIPIKLALLDQRLSQIETARQSVEDRLAAGARHMAELDRAVSRLEQAIIEVRRDASTATLRLADELRELRGQLDKLAGQMDATERRIETFAIRLSTVFGLLAFAWPLLAPLLKEWLFTLLGGA